MTIIKRWWVFWYAETPWHTYSEGSSFFENEGAAEAFCEAMLEDEDVYKVRIEEHLTYIKGKEERNEHCEY